MDDPQWGGVLSILKHINGKDDTFATLRLLCPLALGLLHCYKLPVQDEVQVTRP